MLIFVLYDANWLTAQLRTCKCQKVDDFFSQICTTTNKKIFDIETRTPISGTTLSGFGKRRRLVCAYYLNDRIRLCGTLHQSTNSMCTVNAIPSVDIDDQEMAMAALNGLPVIYERLTVALDAVGNDEKSFSFDIVKSRLLQEEQRALE